MLTKDGLTSTHQNHLSKHLLSHFPITESKKLDASDIRASGHFAATVRIMFVVIMVSVITLYILVDSV